MVPNIIFHAVNFASASVNCLGEGSNLDGSCDTGLPAVNANGDTLHTVLQYAFGVIGALALITIMVAAIQFVTSGGDPNSAARARETLIYAAVGLLVAIAAESIVTFVLTNT